MTITRRFILNHLHDRQVTPVITPNHPKFVAFAEELVFVHYGLSPGDLSTEIYEDFHKKMSDFKSYVKDIYNPGRNYKTFIGNPHHQEYYDTPIPSPLTSSPPPPPPPKTGRPSLPFEEMGRSRRSDAIKKVADDHSEVELFEALALKLKRRGFSKAVKVVNFLAEDPESNGKKIVDSLSTAGKYYCT